MKRFILNMRYLSAVLYLVVSLLFASCEKAYGIEMVSTPDGETTISIEVGRNAYTPQEQDVVMEAVRSRRQISEATFYDGVYSVTFTGDRTAHLLCDFFPLVSTDDGLVWKLNGAETGVPVQFEEDGKVVLPALTPKVDFWYLGDYGSPVATSSYLEYDASVSETHLVGLVEYQDCLFVYCSDGSIDSVSIIKEGFYRVPDYWLEPLVEQEKRVEEAITEADGNCAAFAFLTDTHWGYNYKHSPALIRHLTEYTSVSKVFFGGDVITEHSANTVTPVQLGLDFQASFSFLGPHFYCVFGNHDNNSDGQPYKTVVHLTEEQVCSFLQSHMTELDRKEGYNFYFDDPETKTRYIGLDTGRYHYAIFRSNCTETAKFLIEALSDVPENWHVITVSHIWADYKKRNGVEVSEFSPFYDLFLNIIHDFNARKTGTFTYQKQSVDYDFTESRAYAECCIGGHTHLNSILRSRDELPVVLIGKDSMKRNYITPTEGTLREQCVAVFVFDYNQRKIKLFYVGYGDDQTIDFPAHE